MKRDYRFNDEDESIYMDIKLPNDEEWMRITLEMAKKQNRKRTNASNNHIRRRLAETSPRQNDNPMSTRMGLTRGRDGGFGSGAIISLFPSPNLNKMTIECRMETGTDLLLQCGKNNSL